MVSIWTEVMKDIPVSPLDCKHKIPLRFFADHSRNGLYKYPCGHGFGIASQKDWHSSQGDTNQRSQVKSLNES